MKGIVPPSVPALLVAGAANAAEIYNKDGQTNCDLFGKVDGLHYFRRQRQRRRPDLHAYRLSKAKRG